jgi:hypothetical protein
MAKQIEIRTNKGTSQLFIKSQFLETVKVKGDFSGDEYNNSLRVYCTHMNTKGNTAFNIQLRAFGNLHHTYEKSTAKDAQYISTIGVTIKEMEEILEFMKREEGQYGALNKEGQWIGHYNQDPHKDAENEIVKVSPSKD